MNTIVQFNSKDLPSLEQAGGKARALMQMTAAGMPVPPGFVLTVQFFETWIESLKQSAAWKALSDSNADEISQTAKALQVLCGGLQFTAQQKAELDEALGSPSPLTPLPAGDGDKSPLSPWGRAEGEGLPSASSSSAFCCKVNCNSPHKACNAFAVWLISSAFESFNAFHAGDFFNDSIHGSKNFTVNTKPEGTGNPARASSVSWGCLWPSVGRRRRAGAERDWLRGRANTLNSRRRASPTWPAAKPVQSPGPRSRASKRTRSASPCASNRATPPPSSLSPPTVALACTSLKRASKGHESSPSSPRRKTPDPFPRARP